MSMMMRTVLRVLPLVVAAALLATSAYAQVVDPKAEQELAALGHRIDKTGGSGDSARVTAKIVDQWRGTRFKFDASSAPRELTAQDVQDLRQKKLGYGQISTLLALTAKQPDPATAKPLSEVVAMRQGGMGMGNVAKELGYKNLGSVIKSVKTTETAVGTATASARADKPGKAEKADRPDRPEKPQKPERPEKPGR